jgi:hypothetical protein
MARVGIGAMLALLGRGSRVPPDAHLRQRYRLGRGLEALTWAQLRLSGHLEFESFDLGCTAGVENKNELVKNESLLLNEKLGA